MSRYNELASNEFGSVSDQLVIVDSILLSHSQILTIHECLLVINYLRRDRNSK